ncbi:surface protein, partial [Psychroflexus salarius]
EEFGLGRFVMSLSTANYDALLQAWSQLELTNSLSPNFGETTYSCAAADARQSIIDTYGWTIDDGGSAVDCDFAPFVTTWQTTSSNEYIAIPTSGGADITDFNFTIDWGDGTTETITGDDPDPIHMYASAGTYTVSISGTFPWMNLWSSGEANAGKLQSVEQWGDIQWESMKEMFGHASNMTYNATDIPDLTNVTDLSYMFRGASSFNGDISNWDLSSVENMNYMFFDATSFNQNINTKVINEGTPEEYVAWDVSSVTTMLVTFSNASSFNQSLDNWDVSNVTEMYGMFDGASAFNGDISTWNINNVNDMVYMFRGASAFNQNINTKVINEGAPEEYIAWDVSHGPSIYAMFVNATSFNQPLDQWDVSQVTDLDYMFDGATAFNQDLSSWDVSQSAYFNDFLTGTAFSQENYDALLQAWSQLDLVDGMTMNLDAMYSCAAAEARQSIIDNNNWTINDGGSAVDCDFAPFVTTWQTTSSNENITIPTGGGADITDFDFTIDWGDGTIETITGDDPDPSHSYAAAGTYTVSIRGTFPWMQQTDAANAVKLQTVVQWGDI